MRPDLFVHRLIERLGLRRQQLFTAQAEVVERLRELARFGELATAYVRAPAAGDAARVRALDRRRRRGRPARGGGAAARRRARRAGDRDARRGKGSSSTTSTCSGCTRRGCRAPHTRTLEPIARRAAEGDAAAGRPRRARRRDAPAAARRDDARAHAAGARAPAGERPRRRAAALAVRRGGAGGGRRGVGGARARSCSAPPRRCTRRSGSCATSCSRRSRGSAGALGELRFDTDLDVSHAVVRYLELLKLAALIERPRGPERRRGARGRQRRARGRRSPPSSARSSRPRRSTSTCSTPSATSSRRAAGDRGARGAVAGAVPAAPRRRARAVGLRHRDLPHLPAEVQVRARLPHPAGADDQPALRDPRPPGARALPRRAGEPRALARSCSGCSRPAGAAAASAAPSEELQLRGKATAALARYHERFQERGRRADLVRALVLLPARPAPAARARRPRRPPARRAATS